MQPVTDTDGWLGVDVPNRVRARWQVALRVNDMAVTRVVVFDVEYEDGTEATWALPENVAESLAAMLLEEAS